MKKNPGGRWQNTRRWIRPISHQPNANGAILREESFLRNKNTLSQQPQLFDIIEIPLSKLAHVEGQPENWLIEEGASWRYLGQVNPQTSVDALIEQPNDLWSEQGQMRDRVTPEWLAQHDLPSLYLIQPEQIKIYRGPSRSRRAAFSYNGVDYNFGMTDPEASKKHFPDYNSTRAAVAGQYSGISLNCAAICVSLAPAWKARPHLRAYHYKLVASIIEKE